jgi:hypothetical protein
MAKKGKPATRKKGTKETRLEAGRLVDSRKKLTEQARRYLRLANEAEAGRLSIRERHPLHRSVSSGGPLLSSSFSC